MFSLKDWPKGSRRSRDAGTQHLDLQSVCPLTKSQDPGRSLKCTRVNMGCLEIRKTHTGIFLRKEAQDFYNTTKAGLWDTLEKKKVDLGKTVLLSSVFCFYNQCPRRHD